MKFTGLLATALLLPTIAHAGEAGDILTQHLYAGTVAEGQAALAAGAEALEPEACFGAGFLSLASGIEGLAQDLYRYGATTPGTPAAALMLGIGGMPETAVPANPNPETLTYEALRGILADFRADLTSAQQNFECPAAATEGADFVVPIEVLKVRIDFDGDGQTSEAETLQGFLEGVFGEMTPPMPDEPLDGGKSKTKGGVIPEPAEIDSTIGFDVADSIWLAGYSQVIGVQVDMILAHNFEDFFNAYLHRVFPASGLPMQDYSEGGTLFMDPSSDAGIADIIAAIHTLDFPVADRELFQSIPAQLKRITALSRQNWDLIMAETDDDRELLPNPTQTSLIEGQDITPEMVAAWRETLDVLDRIVDGELLIPHWRFKQGFDLKAFFENSERTDLVMLLTGQGALAYLADGPIADADSFALANSVFGENVFNYAAWFN
ncbi:hypothetical protein [Devosia sp. SL43]|uniref:hypothetical protein n=1 Tax=Devosia sp. SL43 TaxID=2806348 RepID=UPI001F1F28D3|nr:hypothetical protein [Devosia sp. SL43]UJW86736.1 hypothetical protein IM737_05635 [Devosia sp. SL43]